jgi:hypothetical protein
VDVLDVDDDLLADLDGLLFEVPDRLAVVGAPLGTASVAVVLTAHAFDAF